MKSFLIGAATSNSGKTTFTMGLLRALTQRGLCVQPFKCGPDYIDTIFHHMASGNESLNLDTFMASAQHVRNIFSDYSQNADVAIAEGVMGLFDGYDGFHGSSAEIAIMLHLPVILIVNAKSMAYSVAPLIYGFKNFNKNLQIAGVVFKSFPVSEICLQRRRSGMLWLYGQEQRTDNPRQASWAYNIRKTGNEQHHRSCRQRNRKACRH